MKFYKLLIASLLLVSNAFSQNYTATDDGSKVTFIIKNFGFKTAGSFKGVKGNIVFNPNSLTTSHFNVTVNAGTINTDNSARDKHLRKEEYFDVEKYPLISFVSKSIVKSKLAGYYTVAGNFIIKGISQPIQFDFSAVALGSGYMFKGEFDINRRNFGVGGNSFSLADNLKVSLEILAKK